MRNVRPGVRLLAIGGAHIDRRGTIAGEYIAGASNPGTLVEEIGGGVFNALRSAVPRGALATLISVRGGDLAGSQVAEAVARAGIADLSAVFLDRTTPSYTALLSQDGGLIAGLADMALYDTVFAKQMRRSQTREAAAAADAILCDANLPAAGLETLARIAGHLPVHAIAISPAKVVRLAAIAGRIATLFANRAEALALAALPAEADAAAIVEALRQRGFQRAVISHGGEPVLGFDAGGVFVIQPPAPRLIADVTGAGDALAGAAVAALMRGLALRDAVREGMAAALLALESPSAVPDYASAAFENALAQVQPTSTLA